jgi:diadenosine tetraphosphate (Ap4A) HIT family hydrolase
MSACYFCARLREPPVDPVIFEDERIHVSHSIDESRPLSPLGVVVIQSKRHVRHGLAELTNAEGRRVGEVVAGLSRGLRRLTGAPWTYTYAFTEGYRHFHQFVAARYRGVPPRYLRLGILAWPGYPRGGIDEVRGLAGRLRRYVPPAR